MESYGRMIDYLRVSVTDRCNLRCVYCMPPGGIEKLNSDELLKYEDIVRIIEAGADLGLKKIRFTGGEPLVRKGFVNLVKKTREIGAITDISITTNGILLDAFAASLKEAGLDRVNISLDTLNEKKFEKITRGGDLNKVFEGIKAAQEVGLSPVKINVVVIRGFNDEEVSDFIDYGRREELEIRFIEYMPIGESTDTDWKQSYVSVDEIKSQCSSYGEMFETSTSNGNGPAKYYDFKDSKGKIGFISAVSEHFCESCNRLRLTSDGKIKNCLFSDKEFDIMPSLDYKEKIKETFKKSVQNKPKEHIINSDQGAASKNKGEGNDKENGNGRNMIQIGG